MSYPDSRLPFAGGFQITQAFGKRPAYYKKFGFAGHEGLDAIPLSSDWSIYCIESGEVITDTDAPERFGAYGNVYTVFNKESGRLWWYAHNASNLVSAGQQVAKGQKLGLVGATGNASGPHLHLGLQILDTNKQVINKNNGYKGFIDPLPFLLDGQEVPMTELQTQLDACMADRAKFWKERDTEREENKKLQQRITELLEEKSKNSDTAQITKLQERLAAAQKDTDAQLQMQSQQLIAESEKQIENIRKAHRAEIDRKDAEIDSLKAQVVGDSSGFINRITSRKFLLVVPAAVVHMIVAFAVLFGYQVDPTAMGTALASLDAVIALFVLPEAYTDHKQRLSLTN